MTDTEKARKISQFIYNMRRLHTTHHLSEQRKVIGNRDMFLLVEIYHLGNGKAVRMNKLSEYFKVSPAAISQMIGKLEKQGWLERFVGTEDRRNVNVQLTEKGKNILHKCEEKMSKRVRRLIDHIGEEDSDTLIRILEKLVDFKDIEDVDDLEGEKDA